MTKTERPMWIVFRYRGHVEWRYVRAPDAVAAVDTVEGTKYWVVAYADLTTERETDWADLYRDTPPLRHSLFSAPEAEVSH